MKIIFTALCCLASLLLISCAASNPITGEQILYGCESSFYIGVSTNSCIVDPNASQPQGREVFDAINANWTRDGKYILYEEGGNTFQTNGSGAARVTDTLNSYKWLGTEKLSPDGRKKLVLEKGEGGFSVYLSDADGQNRKLFLFQECLGCFEPHARFSPDSRWVAAAINFATGSSSEPRLIEVETGDIRKLGDTYPPVWSPDGLKMALLRPASLEILSNDKEVATIPADGVKTVVWSPDSEWLALVQDDKLYRIRYDGTERLELADKVRGWGISEGVSWSPDGKRIAFMSNGIEIINVDGTDRRHLVQGTNPRWRPGDW